MNDALIDKHLREIYNGVHKIGDIPQNLFLDTYKLFSETIDKSFGGAVSYDDDNYTLVNNLKRNVANFTAFREATANAWLVRQFETKAYHSFAEYKKDTAQIIKKYYQEWREAEHDIVAKSSRMADKWQGFERTKHLYPNLKYMPSGAAEPRDDHSKWYGLVKPIGDPIWQHITPPNGWGCDCSLQKTRDAASTDVVQVPTPISGISGNAALSEEIFTASHSYVSNMNEKERKRIKKDIEPVKQAIPYKDEADYTTVDGAKIFVHDLFDEADIVDNYLVAKEIVEEFGYEIRIRPHILIENQKNPEYLINGKIADLKHQFGKRINSNVKKAIKQNCRIIVFKLGQDTILTPQRVHEQIIGEVNVRKKGYDFDEIIVYDKKGNT